MPPKSAIQDSHILIVDDLEANTLLLECILRPAGFSNLTSVTDARRVIAVCREVHPDLILLDLRMPHLDGLSVMQLIASEFPDEVYLPVLVLSADIAPQAKKEALSKGAKDFLAKPFDLTEVLLRVNNLLETRALYKQIDSHRRTLEGKVRERTLQFAEAQVEILQRLALAAEYRDDETGQHTQRVGMLCAMLGQAIGQSAKDVELLRLATPLHDVGKIGIPDRIFLKAGKLTPEEFHIMQTHTTIGGDILGRSRFPVLQLAREVAMTHHERWDGQGYPRGIAGEAIPLPGRIAAIADVFDALTHARPYKEAWSLERAASTIEREAGRQFDPNLVGCFMRMLQTEGLTNLAQRISETAEERPISQVIIESLR